MMKTKFLGLVAAAGMLLATSCSQDMTDSTPSSGELVDVSFSVGVEEGVGTRGAFTRAEGTTTTKISDGTRATELYFAIYDNSNKLFKFTPTFTMIGENGTATGESAEGTLVVSGEDPLYYTATVKFPFTFSCQLVKGRNYKIVLWAQSENGNTYYDMSGFPVVEVKYKDEEGNFHANNDEMRDAFCVSYPIKAGSVSTSHNIVLTRPLSQINVGMTEKAWDICLTTGGVERLDPENEDDIKKMVSSMIIEKAATKFNVRANDIVKDNLMEVNYQADKVPFLQDKLNNVDVIDNNRYLYVDLDHNSSIDEKKEKFHWVSMCYILANDESKEDENKNTYGTVIDDLEINICNEQFKLNLQNVPVKRNYRTNILFDDSWWTTRELIINLDRAYDNDDYNGTEENGSYKEIRK